VYAPCRSHRPADRAIHGPDEAIHALRLATDDGRLDATVVACVDAARQPLTMFIFEGPRPADDVELALDALLGAAAQTDSLLAGVFVGLSRGEGEPGPTPQDEERWLRMSDACADAGIELLDWFVLTDGTACSVAEGLRPGPGW